MLVVTHEMGFARRVADLMVFMDDGEIVEAAPPDTFFASPANERTRTFLSQIHGQDREDTRRGGQSLWRC